jgi:hypothetical protein
LHSTGLGEGPVVDCCECGDEPSGSCATELVLLDSILTIISQVWLTEKLFSEPEGGIICPILKKKRRPARLSKLLGGITLLITAYKIFLNVLK